jgi:hypothetical protein
MPALLALGCLNSFAFADSSLGAMFTDAQPVMSVEIAKRPRALIFIIFYL